MRTISNTTTTTLKSAPSQIDLAYLLQFSKTEEQAGDKTSHTFTKVRKENLKLIMIHKHKFSRI